MASQGPGQWYIHLILAECKPSNALIGSESFIRLPSARRAFFWAPRLGMTRRVSRAGASPAAFLWPVRFQIRYGRPLRRSRAKSPPRRCLARARCTARPGKTPTGRGFRPATPQRPPVPDLKPHRPEECRWASTGARNASGHAQPGGPKKSTAG